MQYRMMSLPTGTTAPSFCQEGFLFSEPAHLCQQSPAAPHVWVAVNPLTDQIDARCAFFVTDGPAGVAVSPAAAPFGSIECSEQLRGPELNRFIEVLETDAARSGASALRLNHYPRCYAPTQTDRLTEQLDRRGFRLVGDTATFYRPVTPAPFETGLHASARRRLVKCRRAGFRVEYWPTPPIDRVLAFVQESRRRQGYPLTIPPARLQALLSRFPERFPVFAVLDGPVLIALTVAVLVRSDILYNFLPADHHAYRSFSPLVLLTAGLYAHAQQTGVQLLDLGVALDHTGQFKPGLARFKRNLGAVESPKMIFEKYL